MENISIDNYIGRMLDNRYELLEVIGKGGMAFVFKAKCHLLNRFVAVKILREDMAADEEFRERFNKEAQAVAMLSHPNIVPVYDVSRSPDIDYIVMELVEGTTLKQYMQDKGELTAKESVNIAMQIGKALSHAHSKGIIHRDIKPQNVMIALDGTVKVGDFGIAYLENTQAAESRSALGSIHYISPEQARGLSPDARSDIYSMGVVLYEMITGRLPFKGDTPESVALQHLKADPEPPRSIDPEIPAELERITLKAMCRDIESRYQTVGEFLSDMENFRVALENPSAGKNNEDDYIYEDIRDVRPIGRTGEMEKQNYIRRRRRSQKVSILSGFLLVMIFAVATFVFLWNYWLKDVFSETSRVSVPDFTGVSYEKIISDRELQAYYNFKITYDVAPNVTKGYIVSQEPAAGRNLILPSEGIDVTLYVSTGMQMVQVNDVVNYDYRDAVAELERQGFTVKYDFEKNDFITQNYVISQEPVYGESAAIGSDVHIIVSSGPTVASTKMPNLIGLNQSQAQTKLENAKLILGDVTQVSSNMPTGTVVYQSVDAGATLDEHSKIIIQVSLGPSEG